MGAVYNVSIATKREAAKMGKVTKDMAIADVLRLDEGTAPIFIKHGMHCLGCPSAIGESVEEACFVHGMDPGNLLNDLNEYLESTAV